jgi:predicted nucleic-acid-binding protein
MNQLNKKPLSKLAFDKKVVIEASYLQYCKYMSVSQSYKEALKNISNDYFIEDDSDNQKNDFKRYVKTQTTSNDYLNNKNNLFTHSRNTQDLSNLSNLTFLPLFVASF